MWYKRGFAEPAYNMQNMSGPTIVEVEEVRDISESITTDDLPVCPLCASCIDEHEAATWVRAHGCKFMVHVVCIF